MFPSQSKSKVRLVSTEEDKTLEENAADLRDIMSGEVINLSSNVTYAGPDDLNTQQIEPSKSPQFEPIKNQKFEPSIYQYFEPSESKQSEPSENQQFEPSESQQFDPKQLPIPLVSPAVRAVRQKNSDQNLLYYYYSFYSLISICYYLFVLPLIIDRHPGWSQMSRRSLAMNHTCTFTTEESRFLSTSL